MSPKLIDICRVVCRHCKISHWELTSPSRAAPFVRCRHITAYLCFKLTTRSSTQIGRLINRDHTVALYARDKITAELRNDSDLAAEIADLEAKIMSECTAGAVKYLGAENGQEETALHAVLRQ